MTQDQHITHKVGLAKKTPLLSSVKFSIGQIVRHKTLDFRGVVFDIDPVFSNSDEWYFSIPEDIRPDRDQPFYHLFAESEGGSYIAYVSQQNLVLDSDAGPVYHPQLSEVFSCYNGDNYELRRLLH